LFTALASRWCERCGGEVVAGQNPAGAVNAVESAHPFCGFFQLIFGKSSNLYFRWYTPSMVGLVVDDPQILGGVHFAQNFAHISLVAKRSAFVHAASFADLFLAVPIQLVPIPDLHTARLSLAQFVLQAGRN